MEDVMDFFGLGNEISTRKNTLRKYGLLNKDGGPLDGVRYSKRHDHLSTDPKETNVYWMVETKSAAKYRDKWIREQA